MGYPSILRCPDDILQMIFSHLLKPLEVYGFQTVARVQDDIDVASLRMQVDGECLHSLGDLSSTCHALRAVCMPIMFRSIYFSSIRHCHAPPAAILIHVRTVRFYGLDLGPSHVVFNAALSQMLQLSHIVLEELCEESTARTTAHLATVLAAPTLRSLTLREVGLSSFGQPTSPTPQLRVFRMSFCNRLRSLLSMSLEAVTTEMTCLQSFLESMRHQFEILRLPGESTRFSFLAASPWPCLRELTICGSCPSRDVPVSEVLRAMPELRSFTLAVAQHRSAPPIMLLRDGIAPPDLRHLQRFVLSFPHPDDRIFEHLPAGLLELSLRDTPRHWSRKMWQYRQDHVAAFFGSPLLTCQGAMHIFSMLRCDNLERLELVVREDEFEERMFQQLAGVCPRLHFLELHRYRAEDEREEWGAPAVVPVLTVARRLSAFPALRVLRLNLNFPLIFLGNLPEEDMVASQQFFQEQARRVVECLPSLTTLSLFARLEPSIQELNAFSPGKNGWRVYTVESSEASHRSVVETVNPPRHMREDFREL